MERCVFAILYVSLFAAISSLKMEKIFLVKKQGERIVKKKNFSLTISLCSFKTRKGDEEKG